ncbi:MAG: hypothetical protein M1814_000335 [Vezdaea aestivalis]|nr:MAG: hypothetical protein M1814_000335 [Vezdaea aestivalis]
MPRSHRHNHVHGHKPLNLERRSVLSQPDTFAVPINEIERRSILENAPQTLVGRTPPGGGGPGSGGTSGGSSVSTSSSVATASSTCGPDDKTGACQRPTDSNTTTLPIVLGAVIPILCAIAVFIYLHRRHVKKLRNEDAMDKHKSLDFGMDGASPSKKDKKSKKGTNKNEPEMATTDLDAEKEFRRGKGMSMDMGSPYLLPPEMQGSRESLHSLSRTIHNGDDRYRPATTFVPNDGSSIRSFPSRRNFDDSSVYTASSGGPLGLKDSSQHELLPNAQRMSKSSVPKRTASLSSKHPDNATLDESPSPPVPVPASTVARKALPTTQQPGSGERGLAPPTQTEDRDSYIDNDGGDMRRSNNYLGAIINREPSPMDSEKHPSSRTSPQGPLPEVQLNGNRRSPPATTMTSPHGPIERQQSYEAPIIQVSDEKEAHHHGSGEYGGAITVTAPSEHHNSDPQHYDPTEDYSHYAPVDHVEDYDNGALGAGDLGYDIRRISMSFRPLPPEDPTDDPEQRANRIRSFYKEYFDDSRPGPYGGEEYYEDYGAEYFDDAAFFDEESGQFIVANAPHAEPVTRRAMTPPPRAPPRFRGPPGHGPSMSYGNAMPHGSRAFSSQSGRFGPGPRRGPPRKALPPPQPLRELPTPHMLKDDNLILPIDFAPPRTMRDRAAGRPATPTGGLRPYTPHLPTHMPLASSFDDLAVMPSPHALRRSGTFTALDFAPPPRFRDRDGGNGSDSGSIRSNRSGVSATHAYNIRTGAYRVSRLPKEVVGTKQDLMAELKPSWGMRAGS